jgi:hypothetical protein
MLQAKNVKIKYNGNNGAWFVEYQGPSKTYKCEEFGVLPGADFHAIHAAAGQAVLAASNLVIPPMNGVDFTFVLDTED